MTAVGPIDLTRSHGYCKDCGQPQFAADRLLGIDGWLTPRARSMADTAGISDPFRQAEALLKDLAGWKVDAETIRRYCHQDAAAARAGRAGRSALPESFAQAPGDRELQIDAGKVNTTDGGHRDVKVAVHCCRERGGPASSEDYEQRDLPAPCVRSVIAEIEGAHEFGKRCRAEALRLGVSAEGLSVLGDGAAWIWDLVALYFAAAWCVLDVYHGGEHLACVGRAAFGEGEGLKEWLEGARQKMVADGYAGVCEVVAGLCADEEMAARVGAVAALELNYFGGNKDRMGYAVRLHRGQAIGSGLVEGTIKQRINLRLKRANARWLAEHVGPFVELLAMRDSPEWSEFWALVAA
jgi:hypothetical protein